MNGTVPHPTAIALPPTFPAFLGLDDSTPLQVQAPNLSIMDLFHTAAVPQSVRFTSLASEKVMPSSASRMVPLGYLLSSLLLQSPGAASQQEANLFRDFLLLAQSDVEPLMTPDLPHDFSIADVTAVLGVTGSFWILPRAIAGYLTTGAGPQDLCVIQDDIDCLLVQEGCQNVGATLLPLPGAKDIEVAVTHDVNGLAARRLVRDKWNTLGYLASRFAPGGSLGADNKLFAFAHVPGAQLNGTTRFEHGVPVHEFKDLRANTRCVLESQAFGVKARATELGLGSPHRVVLVDNTDNHLLGQVFATDVYTPEVRQDAISFGAALLIHNLPQISQASYKTRNESAPNTTPPLTPSTTGPNSPPRFEAISSPKCPPSPAPSDTGVVRVRLITPKPQDTWEHELYNAMMPEFLRLSGIVVPSAIF
ncbi:hypothetical protein A1Q2_01714 [Trichosporon asahii var. asahii CBS 8904]|uniref:Uncharacterized protein n=1 Tax=Trichosporon asahii var. asahii (strain CBS 8904) TaxID=1220162 RepID=K1VIU1_TRIAC|nr:hypothetical protein A1Q2_01714 [Trichosporon asahii var. asahii CBS 8904]